MERLRLGGSLDKTVDMAAVVSESHKSSIEEYVAGARLEGAEVGVCTGARQEGAQHHFILVNFCTCLCIHNKHNIAPGELGGRSNNTSNSSLI